MSTINNLTTVVKDVATVVVSGTASAEVTTKRFEICKACPEFDADNSRCKKCGCNIPVKTRFKASKCPLNKWEE